MYRSVDSLGDGWLFAEGCLRASGADAGPPVTGNASKRWSYLTVRGVHQAGRHPSRVMFGKDIGPSAFTRAG
jgi:hypothetical protein